MREVVLANFAKIRHIFDDSSDCDNQVSVRLSSDSNAAVGTTTRRVSSLDATRMRARTLPVCNPEVA